MKRAISRFELVIKALRLQNSKRSQISLFLIIAISLVVIIGFYVFFNKNNQKNNEYLSDVDSKKAYDSLSNCFKITSEEGLFYISERGGFYKKPEYMTETGIPYYLYNEEDYMPSLKTIENELSDYIKNNIYLCAYFLETENSDSTIPEVKSEIKEKNIAIDINYKVYYKKESKNFEFSNFKIEINSDLYDIYNNVSNLIIEDKKNPDSICLGCIINISKTSKYKIKMFDYSTDSMVFIFEDLNHKYNNETFKFNYANKYKKLNIKEIMEMENET